MSKASLFSVADLLKDHLFKQDTWYRRAIPVVVKVACTLYKLMKGVGLLACSETFAIGKSTVCCIVRDVVKAVNDDLRHEIAWPTRQKMRQNMVDFHDLCGLPAIIGTIDGTHLHFQKPTIFPEDYYYFKSGGYSLNSQAIVDRYKHFLNICMGNPGSINDARLLRRSRLFNMARKGALFDDGDTHEGLASCLVADKRYPLFTWLQVPYKEVRRLTILEHIFNKRLSKGRSVVENAFGNLKNTFRELSGKLDLHVNLLPNLMICCCILQNVILGPSSNQVQRFVAILHREGMKPEVDDDPEDDMPDGGIQQVEMHRM